MRLRESLQLWWDRDDKLCVDLTGKYAMLHIPAELEKGQSCSKGCALTSEDVDVAMAKIEESLAVRDAERVFKVDLYLPLKLFNEANRAVLQSFIERVNTTFVETGRLQWGSQRDVYEAYVAYNATAP